MPETISSGLIGFLILMMISEIILAFIFAVIAQVFYRKMGLDFKSIFKGFIERVFLLICLSQGFAHALTLFGALKVATRLKRQDADDKDLAAYNDFYLVGNLVSVMVAIGYVILLQHMTR
jgi:hypothetical protein